MITLSARIRDIEGRKLISFREDGGIPGVLYGPEIKNPLKVSLNQKEFSKIYKEVGKTSLISLDIEGGKQKFSVLIHDIQENPISGNVSHVDLYQPRLKEKTTVTVHIVFDGEAPAQKEFGGTFVKNISEIEVRALPQDLPKEIVVDISVLKTLDDKILVKDLKVAENVEILKDKEEVVAHVAPLQNIEEDLERPIEENVESVEKVEKKAKEENLES